MEKGGPKSVYWTLSRRSHHQDPRSRGQSRSSPPHPSHVGKHPRRQRGADAHSGSGREELHRRQRLRLERCCPGDPTATHEGRYPAQGESSGKTQVQPQALPDSALRRELLLQDQAVSTRGYPVRKDRYELSRVRSLRGATRMACLNLGTGPSMVEMTSSADSRSRPPPISPFGAPGSRRDRRVVAKHPLFSLGATSRRSATQHGVGHGLWGLGGFASGPVATPGFPWLDGG